MGDEFTPCEMLSHFYLFLMIIIWFASQVYDPFVAFLSLIKTSATIDHGPWSSWHLWVLIVVWFRHVGWPDSLVA